MLDLTFIKEFEKFWQAGMSYMTFYPLAKRFILIIFSLLFILSILYLVSLFLLEALFFFVELVVELFRHFRSVRLEVFADAFELDCPGVFVYG